METLVNSDLGNLGKVFEAKMSQAFRDLQSRMPVHFKRLVDSREAGNLIKCQESDFEFIVNSASPGQPFHFMLEAKSSDKFEAFATCFRSMVKSKQRAMMMIRERAGCKGYYLFYSGRLRQIELWDGSIINDAWPEKRKPLNKQPRMVIDIANLPDFALYMAKNPGEFITPAM